MPLHLRLAVATLALLASTNAAPTGLPHLLGNSFGVPGNATFDYVVVGAGNGGTVVAYRLAEAGKSVALVEAGSLYEIGNGNLTQIPGTDIYFTGKDATDTNSLVDWNFVAQPQRGLNNAADHYARGKCLGGNTARNFMTYHIASESSYQRWADEVDDQSYSYNKFMPFFKKSMKFSPPNRKTRFANSTPEWDESSVSRNGLLSVSYPNYVGAWSTWAAKGWKELGVSAIKGFTSGKLIGYGYNLNTINADLQTRESSKTAFLEPAIENLPRLTIYQSTMAKRITFDGNKQANGVIVNSGGQTYLLSATKEVVVSAGSFQSPQLLMVSGVGPKETLQKHNIPVVAALPGVGQNMQDHVLSTPAWRVNFVTASSVGNPAFYASAVSQYNSNPRTGILTNPGVDVIAWQKIPMDLRSNLSKQAQSDLAKFPDDWPELEFLHVGGFIGYARNLIRDAPTDGANYMTVATALMMPLSRGTVDIVSADTADLPLINPNWFTHPTDVETMVAGIRRARQLMATRALREVVVGDEYFPGTAVQSDADIVAWLRNVTKTVYHAACTCKMGRSNDTMAVIDSRARVYGVKNLRVVDASSMPFLPPAHPMATIYALGEKIADDMLKG